MSRRPLRPHGLGGHCGRDDRLTTASSPHEGLSLWIWWLFGLLDSTLENLTLQRAVEALHVSDALIPLVVRLIEVRVCVHGGDVEILLALDTLGGSTPLPCLEGPEESPGGPLEQFLDGLRVIG